MQFSPLKIYQSRSDFLLLAIFVRFVRDFLTGTWLRTPYCVRQQRKPAQVNSCNGHFQPRQSTSLFFLPKLPIAPRDTSSCTTFINTMRITRVVSQFLKSATQNKLTFSFNYLRPSLLAGLGPGGSFTCEEMATRVCQELQIG